VNVLKILYSIMVTTRSGKSYTIDARVKRKRAPAKKKGAPVNAKQVRRMIMGISETKRYHSYQTNAEILSGFQYNINPMYWIPIGTNEGSRVGDKLFIQSFDLHLKLDRSSATKAIIGKYGNQHIPFTVKLVRTVKKGKQGTTGDAGFSTIGLGDMRQDGIGNSGIPINNLEEFQVIWEIHDIIPPVPDYTQQNEYNGYVVKKRIPINRNFVYDGITTTGNSGYSKDYNYYFYLAVDSQCTNGLSVLFAHSDIQVNFKDM